MSTMMANEGRFFGLAFQHSKTYIMRILIAYLASAQHKILDEVPTAVTVVTWVCTLDYVLPKSAHFDPIWGMVAMFRTTLRT